MKQLQSKVVPGAFPVHSFSRRCPSLSRIRCWNTWLLMMAVGAIQLSPAGLPRARAVPGTPTVTAEPAPAVPVSPGKTPEAVPKPRPDGPRIAFSITEQTVAGIPGGEIAHFLFEVRNEGKKELKLLQVQPSCGCTLASFDPSIPPGGKGKIQASVQTLPLWTKMVKYLMVYSDDPIDPVSTLTLNVEVTPAVTISPDKTMTVPYDEVKPIIRTFTVQSHRKEPMKLDPPASSGPITVKVEPDPKSADTYQVNVILTPPPSGGDAVGIVNLNTNLSGVPPVQLTLVGVGQKGIVSSPGTFNFGVITPGRRPIQSTIYLFSRKSTFHILKIEGDDPTLSATYTLQPGNSSWYNVTASSSGEWKKGIHQGSLTVYTDLPMASTVKVPYWVDMQ